MKKAVIPLIVALCHGRRELQIRAHNIKFIASSPTKAADGFLPSFRQPRPTVVRTVVRDFRPSSIGQVGSGLHAHHNVSEVSHGSSMCLQHHTVAMAAAPRRTAARLNNDRWVQWSNQSYIDKRRVLKKTHTMIKKMTFNDFFDLSAFSFFLWFFQIRV